MSRYVDRKSDAQANAEALARRDASYSEANRRTWVIKMDRREPPEDLRALISQLRKAYADEVPGRIHVHQTSPGGDPAWSPEFTRYITGSARATDKDDNTFQTPFRAALSGMPLERRMIVEAVVKTGLGPVESAMVMEVPEWCAKMVADSILRMFWRRLSDVRLDLRSESIA